MRGCSDVERAAGARRRQLWIQETVADRAPLRPIKEGRVISVGCVKSTYSYVSIVFLQLPIRRFDANV